MRLPRVVQLRMLMNVAIDLLVGVDPVHRRRGRRLLEIEHEELRAARAPRRRSCGRPSTGDWLFVVGVIAAIVAVALIPLVVILAGSP